MGKQAIYMMLGIRWWGFQRVICSTWCWVCRDMLFFLHWALEFRSSLNHWKYEFSSSCEEFGCAKIKNAFSNPAKLNCNERFRENFICLSEEDFFIHLIPRINNLHNLTTTSDDILALDWFLTSRNSPSKFKFKTFISVRLFQNIAMYYVLV